MITEINRLGQSIGKITIAECVENESVRQILERIGVDLIQGYLIGRPEPMETLAGYLEKTRPRRRKGRGKRR
ncbi:MAG: EAL domain-containing protein, partial [Wenzhouxiangella sp.]